MNDRNASKKVRKDIKATVKFFDEAKGFGFVSPSDGSPDAFVHISVVQNAGYQEFGENMVIICDLVDGDRGQQVAAIRGPEEAEASVSAVMDNVEVEGIVTQFVPEHLYGFVTPDTGGDPIFIHSNMLERSEVDMADFGVDTHVKCVVRAGLKGPIADSLEIL